MLKQLLKTITRLAALPCVLAIAALGSGNAAAFTLPGLSSPSGDGFENDITLKWQKRGSKYVNTSNTNKVSGVLIIAGDTDYVVENLTFKLNAEFDATMALSPGSFLSGDMQIKGTVYQTPENGGAFVADGVLFEADLTAFDFDPNSASVATLFGYDTDITLCLAFMMCTENETVYMKLTDGNIFDPAAITNGKPQSYAAFAVTTVPVPAAVWLFGSGLLGMVSVAKRRNKKVAA